MRGLNTAATIWCSAAMGVLCGFGYPLYALIVASAVLLANTLLRPLAYRLHPVLPAAEPSETLYEIVLACRQTDKTHLRTHLLATIAQEPISHLSYCYRTAKGSLNQATASSAVMRGSRSEIAWSRASRVLVLNCIS